MRKFVIMLIVVMVVSFTACGNDVEVSNPEETQSVNATSENVESTEVTDTTEIADVLETIPPTESIPKEENVTENPVGTEIEETLPTEEVAEIEPTATPEPEYTFVEIKTTLWTIEEAPIFADAGGTEQVGVMPIRQQLYLYRQCVETGYYESADAVGMFYISPDYLVKELPREIWQVEESVEPTQESAEVPSESAETPSGNLNILDPQPEGNYVPSTYEENGYTFLDLGHVILSWNDTKYMYDDLDLTISIGVREVPSSIGLRQCLETGAIEIQYSATDTAWISSDGVRLGY